MRRGADPVDLDDAVGCLHLGKEVVAAGIAGDQILIVEVDDDVRAEDGADDGLAAVVVAGHQPGRAGQVVTGGDKGSEHRRTVEQDELAAAQLVAVGAAQRAHVVLGLRRHGGRARHHRRGGRREADGRSAGGEGCGEAVTAVTAGGAAILAQL